MNRNDLYVLILALCGCAALVAAPGCETTEVENRDDGELILDDDLDDLEADDDDDRDVDVYIEEYD